MSSREEGVIACTADLGPSIMLTRTLRLMHPRHDVAARQVASYARPC